MFENDAKLDFPYDLTFLQSLLVDYLKIMNMDCRQYDHFLNILFQLRSNKHHLHIAKIIATNGYLELTHDLVAPVKVNNSPTKFTFSFDLFTFAFL
jgi:hypothetical protein